MIDVPKAPSLFQQASWRIHVGAHKTGTTYFQKLLDTVRHDVGIQHDVDYVPLAVTRPIVNRARRAGKVEGVRLSEERAASTFLELIRPFRQAGNVIALSEENLLGRPVETLTSPLYGKLESNLAFIENLTRGADREIFLSIRSLADVVPGAFCTALRFKQVKPGQYRHLTLDFEQSWVPVVQRLESVFPNSKVRVFRFEDIVEKPKDVLDTFLGCDTVATGRIDVPRQTVRISADAMDRIAALDGDVPDREWQRLVERISIEHPVTGKNPKFTFLPPDAIDRYDAQYRLDCDILQESGNMVPIER